MATKKSLPKGKKYSSWGQVPMGAKFRVITNTCSHNYEIGRVYKKEVPCNLTSGQVVPGRNSIPISDVEILASTVDAMKEDIATLEAQVNELKEKIAFCIATNTEEFDEDTFKVYQTLQIIKSKKLTDIEQAKAIASLISK